MKMTAKRVASWMPLGSSRAILALYLIGTIGAVHAQERSPRLGTSGNWAEIQVLDEATGRGVPLVELETTNSMKFVTDNAGRVAIQEPGLMGREVFFTLRSHGYEMQKDGFGFAGTRVRLRPGSPGTIKLKRRNLAERLCRLTGEGLYRDSVLLGYDVPLGELNPGNVAGQDSIQSAVYRDQVYWFWGDTSRMEYPLGLFRMAGATNPAAMIADPAFDPAGGIPYRYFVDATGFARAMMPLPDRPEGVVWVGALCVVPDGQGVERLVAHYTRRKGLAEEYEQGVAIFDMSRSLFESAKQLPLDETWRRPSGHPIVYEEEGTKWLLFGSPTPNVRVPATLAGVLDLQQYQAFTCARETSGDKPIEPELRADGAAHWRWQTVLPPMNSQTEHEWLEQGKLRPEDARFCPSDASEPTDRVILHSGSVRWNSYRERWVLVAGQVWGKTSMLGEVWYSEAQHPTGPFAKAVKVVSHDRQSFYNVCHHPILDRNSGQIIHFEGTYTNEFSGNSERTPRYNYNQVLYRLDLQVVEKFLR